MQTYSELNKCQNVALRVEEKRSLYDRLVFTNCYIIGETEKAVNISGQCVDPNGHSMQTWMEGWLPKAAVEIINDPCETTIRVKDWFIKTRTSKEPIFKVLR